MFHMAIQTIFLLYCNGFGEMSAKIPDESFHFQSSSG
jgi:hypothetical protein